MIILRHLSKNYTTPAGVVTALRNINLHIAKGEIFGVIGRSGAGKSTLIRCINLLEKPSSGEVIVNGENLINLSPQKLQKARHQIGMIFQHFNLLSSRTVYENIAFPLELIHTSKKDCEKIITPLLELTGLSDKKNNYPGQLSGGQKQRVAIARALTCEPHVLLCDEATSALDPETTSTILQLLKDIRDNLNLSILLITHEMSVIKQCCDRVGILENGTLIESNEVGEFFAYPQTQSAKHFVHSAIDIDLPTSLKKFIKPIAEENTYPLIRLHFLPDTAALPIITRLIKQFDLQINILQGNVEYIKEHLIGMMSLVLAGDEAKIAAGLNYLKQLGITVEILGYVRNDYLSFN